MENKTTTDNTCPHCTGELNRSRYDGAYKTCLECSKLAGTHIWHRCGAAKLGDGGDFGWQRLAGTIQASCPQSRWYKQADIASFGCEGIATDTRLAGPQLDKFLAKVAKAAAKHIAPKQREALEEKLKVERSRGKYLAHCAVAQNSPKYYAKLIADNAKLVADLEAKLEA